MEQGTLQGEDRLRGYEEDFHGWAIDQAMLLREGKVEALDLENLAEEMEGLARGDRRQLKRRLEALLRHLLKWQFQPELRERNTWGYTIRIQRDHIAELLKESPSLQVHLWPMIEATYARACEEASYETDLLLDTFPETCPWTLTQVLDPEFWPGI